MVEGKRKFLVLGISLLLGLACVPATRAQGPTTGPNVNMVSGTDWTTGDPFLQRQNEPSLAVSTRNASHLLAGANDYRSVDLPGLAGIKEQGDAWLGVFKSFDSGQTWRSTLLPGYPLDSSLAGLLSPIHGFQAASDPMVRAGSNGLLYYSGLAFNRGPRGLSEIFLARFIDRNNKENGDPTNEVGTMTNVVPRDPIRYTGIFPIAFGSDDIFLDKPSLAVDIPRSSATCPIFIPENGTWAIENIPAGRIYVAYTALYTADGDEDDDDLPKVPTAIFFKHSSNCGYTWSAPINLSGANQKNQGSVIAIDPNNGTIYVAWRRFAALGQTDAILVRKSTDGGNSFSPAAAAVTFLPPASAVLSCAPPHPADSTPPGDPTQPGCPFDQSVTTFSFRTNDYGTLTVDGSGRVYLAWTQRSSSPSQLGDARIMINVSQDGVNWPSSSVAAVDDSFLYDDYGMPLQTILGRGHQVMPSLSFNAGKLMLAYYDLREDHTVGVFAPKGDPITCNYGIDFPCNLGAQYSEARDPVGDSLAGPNVFNPYIFDGPDPVLSGAPQITRRHTIDVEAAQAAPLPVGTSGVPSFTPFRVSRYTFGLPPSGVTLADPTQIIMDSSGHTAVQQLQFNPPNLPLFVQGTNAFMGDYIEVAGAPTMIFDPVAKAWKFNTNPSTSPVFHAVWADNRNVRPPLNGDWTKYTPPFSASNPSGGGTSKFDPTKTVPICVNGNTAGMRNQDIYTAQITQGLVVSSLQTAKPLLNSGQPGIQRAFTVLVKNATGAARNFQMNTKVTPATAPVTASFKQFSMVTSVNLVPIPAFSSIAFPVFVQATSAAASNVSVEVDVTEMVAPGSVPLQGSVVLNSDPSNPTLISPDNAVFGSGSISTAEFYNPLMSTSTADFTANNTNLINPAGGNPAGGNPAGGNPAGGNPAGGNVTVTDPTLSTLPNPAGGNPAGGNGTLENPAGGNPAGGNPAGGNTAVADVSWSVTDQGNTSATYVVQLFPTAAIPLCAANAPLGTNCVNLQLLISKLYPTQTVDLLAANSCQLTTQFSNELIVNIPNPPFTSAGTLGNPAGGNPAGGNPAGGNPAGGNPAGGNTALGDATFALQPGGSAQITLRITGPKGSQNAPSPDMVNQVINSLLPVTVSQAVNTVDAQAGRTQPPVSSPGSPIVITNTLPGGANPLPDGEVVPPGSAYRANLTRIGGVSPFAWNETNGWFNSQGVAITPEGCSAGLPPGVTLTDAVNGVISGSPTAAGNYCFTAKVTDAVTNTATANLEIRIASPLVITTASPLPNATQGTGYGPQNFGATGGIRPYGWSLLDAAGLPIRSIDGLTLSSNGVLAGVPAAAGVFNFRVKVTDSGSPAQSANSAMTVNVIGPVALLTMAPVPNGVGGFPFNVAVRAADASDAAVPGVNVTLAIQNNPSGGTLSPALPSTSLTVTTDGAGTASFKVTIDRGATALGCPGSGYTLIATVPGGNPSVISNCFGIVGFAPTGGMAAGRIAPTATLLNNGKVLVTGGSIGGVIGDATTLATAELYDPSTRTFAATGNMNAPRYGHTATLLNNGTVLIVGGAVDIPNALTAEIYDPSAGVFTLTGSTTGGHSFGTATLLGDGTVLIAGGSNSLFGEIYNPATGTFTTTTGSMTFARSYHTATPMNNCCTLTGNGLVLLAGGGGIGNVSTAEFYDPETQRFTLTPNPLQSGTPLELHTATLTNGQVYVIGGTPDGLNGVSSAESFNSSALGALVNPFLFDGFATDATQQLAGGPPNPTTFTLATASWISEVETYHFNGGNGAAPGQITLQGTHNNFFGPFTAQGFVANCNCTSLWVASANIELPADTYTVLDSGPDTWSFSPGSNLRGYVRVNGSPTVPLFSNLGASLNTARAYHTATLLSNGSVLLAGGSGGAASPNLASAEIFVSGGVDLQPSFNVTGSLVTARRSHASVLLPDGTAFVVGGNGNSGPLSSAEIYYPF